MECDSGHVRLPSWLPLKITGDANGWVSPATMRLDEPAVGSLRDVVTEIFLASAEVAGRLLRAPELAVWWTRPSALAEFRTSGLAGHLARAVLNVERYLDTPVTTGARPLSRPPDAVSYFRPAGGGPGGDDPDNASHDVPDSASAAVRRTIRERGEQEAAGGPAALADRYDATRARLAVRLPVLPDDQPVLMFGRCVLPLRECLITRLVELVVHTDDLAVSLGLPTPAFRDDADELVITTLGRIARRRHGTLPVLRTLARRERAPAHIAAF